jgi:hypothetical protein
MKWIGEYFYFIMLGILVLMFLFVIGPRFF